MRNHWLPAYATCLTAALGWVLLTGAQEGNTRFTEIDVERINIREPDGTYRLILSNQARFPEIIVENESFKHPGREGAGMIFYNDEGTENGGLIFGGSLKDGVPHNGGSLTFDRWRQDQVVQMLAVEEGPDRYSGIFVNDRPDGPMDFETLSSLGDIEPERLETTLAEANVGGANRAFMGRWLDASSVLRLRDGSGTERLRLSVSEDGEAEILFYDDKGEVVRRIGAD